MDDQNVDVAINAAKNQMSDDSRHHSQWLLVRGILIVLIGVFAICWPKMTVGLLVKGFGVFLILDGIWGGIVSLRSGWNQGGPLTSLLGIILGATFLFATVASVKFFLALIGAWALVQGIAIVFFSYGKSDPKAFRLFGISGGALALAGIVLVVWPVTGVVAISWLLGGVGLVAGTAMIVVSFVLGRFASWVESSG